MKIAFSSSFHLLLGQMDVVSTCALAYKLVAFVRVPTLFIVLVGINERKL